MKTVCVFASTRGGTILIGVTNVGEVLGLMLGKDTLESLTNRIQQQMDPGILPALATASVERKAVVVVRVVGSPLKPLAEEWRYQHRGFPRGKGFVARCPQ